MYAAKPTSEKFSLRSKDEIKKDRQSELSEARQSELASVLNSYYERWESKETERRKEDMRGAKFMASKMWTEGGGNSLRRPVTSNSGKALLERRIAMTTRNHPVPIVESLENDGEGARVLDGALRTIWRNRRMQELLKIAERKTAATRAIAWYVSWDPDLNGGIGDVHTRIIPSHRFIHDDRVFAVDDMKFSGFVEQMTRAHLVKLYPKRTEEIDGAGLNTTAGKLLSGKIEDPFDVWSGSTVSGRGGNSVQTEGPGSKVRPIRDTKANGMVGREGGDPLADKIEVKFLWFRDDNVEKKKVPKMVKGRPVIKHERDAAGNIKLTKKGHETIDTPWGPVNQPIYEANTHMEMEEVLAKVYPYWRHCSWFTDGGKDVVLWDKRWDGPNPMVVHRDTYPTDGFYQPGSAHAVFSLAMQRNKFLTTIAEKLRLSMDNTYLAGTTSGLKNNRLTAEPGMVYQVRDINQVKEFPHQPLDPSYQSFLDKLEQEMERLVGLPPVAMGEGSGERTAISTYEQLTEAGGVTVIDHAQLIQQTISDWATVVIWFVQTNYTTEHLILVERDDGSEDYTTAFNLITRGRFHVSIEAGSTFNHSPSARFAQVKEGMALGVYTIVDLAKVLPNGMVALKRRAAMKRNPALQWLQGASDASPAQQGATIRAQGRRSHHKPGGK